MRKFKENFNQVTIKEDVKLPGTNIILEKGDIVRVIDSETKRVKESRQTNAQIVEDFCRQYNVKPEVILGLEVFGQISDGEFEDCGIWRVDLDAIEDLKRIYPKSTRYSRVVEDAWDNVRLNLDFSIGKHRKFPRPVNDPCDEEEAREVDNELRDIIINGFCCSLFDGLNNDIKNTICECILYNMYLR